MVRHVKKRKVEAASEKLPDHVGDSVLIRFFNASNEAVGDELSVPLQTSKDDLLAILRANLPEDDDDEFRLVLADSGLEVAESIEKAFIKGLNEGLPLTTESLLRIGYYAMADFKVRPVARLSGTLDGHTGNIVCCQFSPDGSILGTGSGDCTARLWDLDTITPLATLSGHTRVVECLAWSPDGQWVATGSEDKTVRVWRVKDIIGKTVLNTAKNEVPCIVLSGHKHTVVSLAFQPVHLHAYQSSGAPTLLSAARDGSIKIWDIVQGNALLHLDGHNGMCTSVKWSAMMEGKFDGKQVEGPFVYSSGRDMTVRVWSGRDGRLLRDIRCHGHWVNTLTANTDWICRVGPFDHHGRRSFADAAAMFTAAEEAFKKGLQRIVSERVVTCSDDNTLAMWDLLRSSKPLAKMTGHQMAVLSVSFSPSGQHIASAGCDSSIKLWDGRTGQYITTFRGHVGNVHQLAWSPDSSMFVSGSADSTLKVWKVTGKELKCLEDLPGHADEVFAVDWSPDGRRVGSGGRDKKVYLWSH